MEGSPDLFWAMASLAGGFSFLGIGIIFRSLWAPRARTGVPESTGKAQGRMPVPPHQPHPSTSPDQYRLEGRNEILERNHRVLQQELQEVRNRLLEQVAQMAQETSLRTHLEVALGKAHEECDELRALIESTSQANAELTLRKSLLEAENSDLKGRIAGTRRSPVPTYFPKSQTLATGVANSPSKDALRYSFHSLPPVTPPPAIPAPSPTAPVASTPVTPAPITPPPAPEATPAATPGPTPASIRPSAVITKTQPATIPASQGFPAAEPTVLPVRNRAWSLELQNFRRRTAERPVKRGDVPDPPKPLSKP